MAIQAKVLAGALGCALWSTVLPVRFWYPEPVVIFPYRSAVFRTGVSLT